MFSAEIDKFISTNNYPSFSPKAIFFDMDGVLFDSMKKHAVAWKHAMKQVGIEFTEHEAYMNEGRTGASTIDGAYLKTHKRKASQEEKQKLYHLKSNLFESFGGMERMPYAFELTNKIKAENLEIYVVTGSGQPTLIKSLETHFPGIFQKEKMVTAFDVQFGKPNPEPYLMALKKTGLKPWEVVVIENAPLGVKSGSAAGLFTVAVNTGPLDPKVLSDNGANLVFDSMKALFEQWDAFSENWL